MSEAASPAGRAPGATIALVGASIPRSGHHFLADILSVYYGSELLYCPFAEADDCCKQVPCARTEGRRLTFQKSHDFKFDLPAELEHVLYIVQHRHPVPEALSDLDQHTVTRRANNQEPLTATPEGVRKLLARKAIYYKYFHDKWVAPDRATVALVDYDDLSRDPVGTVAALLERVDPSVSRDGLAAAVDTVRPKRSGRGGAYVPRTIEDDPLFDRDLFNAFESLVLDLCPAFGYRRMLDAVDYRQHELFGLYCQRPYRGAEIVEPARRLEVRPKGSPPPPPIALLGANPRPAAAAKRREKRHRHGWRGWFARLADRVKSLGRRLR